MPRPTEISLETTVPAGSPAALGREFFDHPFLDVARDLIGATLLWNGCGGRVVETEAYAAEGDAACHTATRPLARAFMAAHPPGTAYVYLNYGMYWLLNVLARDGIVLFRAIEPLHGVAAMRERRGKENLRDLCSGPGKLGRALGFTGEDHGADLTRGAFLAGPPAEVVTDVRIGISKAMDFPWRFLEKDSPWVSVPCPAPPAKLNTNAGRRRLQKRDTA